MGLTDTSENKMKETVMPHDLENKIAAVVQRAEEHERYGVIETRNSLKLALQDPQVQQWLNTLRGAGRTPNTAFPRIEPGKF